MDNKSLLDFKYKKYHIEVKNIINGNNSIINVGTNENDKTIGKEREEFKFLKNSISSNKFKITPKATNIKIALINVLKNPKTKYLFIIEFIIFYALN